MNIRGKTKKMKMNKLGVVSNNNFNSFKLGQIIKLSKVDKYGNKYFESLVKDDCFNEQVLHEVEYIRVGEW